MSDRYTVRIGCRKRGRDAKSYEDLVDSAYKSAADDGKKTLCGTDPWPQNVTCPDCQKAEVVWAEAAYVSGHRICPHCGSHWSLESPDEPGGQWFLRRARFY